MAVNQYITTKNLNPSPWMEKISTELLTTRSVFRACVGWVLDLGIGAETTYFEKKIITLINSLTFISLLLALPGTFALMLMGFTRPFSLLFFGVLIACLILGFNGARHVEWSKALFALAPAVAILTYSMLELASQRLELPLNYILIRQGFCFALLIPMIIYGYEERHKRMAVAGVSLVIFLLFDVVSMRLGAFQEKNIVGISHGIFSVLSLLQYIGLAGSVLYVQNCSIQHARQAQQTNEKLKTLVIRDGLTGLFNHRFMEQLIGDAINRSKRSMDPLSLLMIDVDEFKQINDTLGHNAGDEVLVRLSRLLNGNKRSTDYLGRWGGDELIMLLTDTDLAGANKLAGKLHSLVGNQTFPYGKHLTISLGASEYQSGDTTASFIARADSAMYHAKLGGRNRVEVVVSSDRYVAVSEENSPSSA